MAKKLKGSDRLPKWLLEVALQHKKTVLMLFLREASKKLFFAASLIKGAFHNRATLVYKSYV